MGGLSSLTTKLCEFATLLSYFIPQRPFRKQLWLKLQRLECNPAEIPEYFLHQPFCL